MLEAVLLPRMTLEGLSWAGQPKLPWTDREAPMGLHSGCNFARRLKRQKAHFSVYFHVDPDIFCEFTRALEDFFGHP